jgi:lysophospholipase-2
MTSSTKRGALIFLHGLGDSPAGWSQLEHSLPEFHARLKDIVYVFPPAPNIPLSINGGMRMPGWFDLYDWPIAVGSKDDPVGLRRSVQQVEEAVTKLQTEHNIPPSKIVVGGFSQGGAVALLAAYRPDDNATGFAGCAGLSAWLTMPEEFQSNMSTKQQQTPLFWGHGEYDDKVLYPQQKFGVDKLKASGVTSILHKSYDMEHESHPDEMKALAGFLDQVLFGNDEDTKEDL